MRLTTSEICSLADLQQRVIADWIEKGLVQPAERLGIGRGQGDRFTPMQAIGIVVAAELRRSERGCVLEYAGKIIEAFAGVTDTWLQKQFAEGKTHFIRVHHGKPLLSGKQYDWIDVRTEYNTVVKVAQ